MGVSRENINTLLAGLALVVSLLTYWNETSDPPDKFNAIDLGLDISEQALDVRGKRIAEAGIDPLVGPFYWRVQIHNPTVHPVSLVSADLDYRSPAGEVKYYSSFDLILSSSKNRTAVKLPITITPGQASHFFVSFFVPVTASADQEYQCLRSGATISEIRRCFGRYGTDLFGNKVEMSVRQSPEFTMITESISLTPRCAKILA